jgi:hypothetical protein
MVVGHGRSCGPWRKLHVRRGEKHQAGNFCVIGGKCYKEKQAGPAEDHSDSSEGTKSLGVGLRTCGFALVL